MAFDVLSRGFRAAKNQLSGIAELTETNLASALEEVRASLLEADVAVQVADTFLESVKGKALGTLMRTRATQQGKRVRVGPAEQFIMLCQQELEALMAAAEPPITFLKHPATTGIMIVGLQGTGKTTTAAKLARLLERENEKKVLLVAADMQRPGAVAQLTTLAERIDVPSFSMEDMDPYAICVRGREHARRIKRNVVIYDTAGRLAIDEPLMVELSRIKAEAEPQEVLLVIDAMMGQDAIVTAAAFHERLGLTGVILTKVDGDARGGAALSVRAVTGAPIKYMGSGETLDKLEVFRASGVASRILGFGDVVGLMKDFEQVVDAERAEAKAKSMLSGSFTLNDFLEQIEMLQQMGPVQDVLEKLPFFAEAGAAGAQIDDAQLIRLKAMVSSMTPSERQSIELFQKQPGRLGRVAMGSGRSEREVAELLQRFGIMRQMIGNIGQQAGMLGKMPGLKRLARAGRLKEQVGLTGLDDNPMLANLAETLLEAAVAENASGARLATTQKRPQDRQKRKNLRKLQRKARKKSRR
ncbi:MAG: signal recognition particle protein [Myxococcales bacterium]|nr:signal recognition particle protein [Myxococcales bacterium]MCB9708313.1 signal recognition particle protein [Myxococcales bacterium]